VAQILNSNKFYAWLNERLKELLILSLIGLNVMLWLSILTYDARDPSLNHARNVTKVYNWLGAPGAFSADILLMLMGYFSHIMFALLLYKLIRLFVVRRNLVLNPFTIIFQSISFILLLITGCAISYIQFNAQQLLPAGSGGIIGKFAGNLLIERFNVHSATFLSLGIWLLSVTLFIKINWLYIFEVTGKIVLALIELIFLGLKNLLLYTNIKYMRYKQELRKAQIKERELSKNILKNQNAQSKPKIDISKIKAVRVLEQNSDLPIKTTTKNYSYKPSLNHIQRTPNQVENQHKITNNQEIKISATPKTPNNLSDIIPLKEQDFDLNDDFDFVIESNNLENNQTLTDATNDELNEDDWFTNNFSDEQYLFDFEHENNYFEQNTNQNLNISDQDLSQLLSPLPELSLLDPQSDNTNNYKEENLYAMSHLLESKLKEFGVQAKVVEVLPGPVITRFEIMPGPGIKGSRISGLERDLARSMAVISVRVVEVIPGKKTIGIEIPNEQRQIINLSSVLQSTKYAESSSYTTLALGQSISGEPVITDLARTPHLLVAGTTGSGKSVGVNAMILSMLFKATPAEVRLIMIDPKMLELSIYEGIPHLLCPVVTDMKEAANALRWAVAEMERRYELMHVFKTRTFDGFNHIINEHEKIGKPLFDPFFKRTNNSEKPELLKPLPKIVVIIDEFADMMMTVGKSVEELIARITQKARAAGIHLILATQRPSVDVITGLIKANIPTRIAFQVSSKIDSRTILDQGGADLLLGHGDMLFLPTGKSIPIRVHGAFVSDNEVQRVVEAWKLRGTPDYVTDIVSSTHDVIVPGEKRQVKNEKERFSQEQYDEAVEFILQTGKISISSIQRYLNIGYNKSADIVEAMEQNGLVSSADKMGRREILIKR